MGLSLEQKQAVVSEVAAKLAGAQAVIVAEYRGLNVERVTQLRAKARKSGIYLRVLKNTLARRAIKGTPFEKLSESMIGPLMYGISQDPVAGAKVLSEFARENELFVIKAGAMPNAMMSAQDIKALAQLPSREELIATLLGTLQAPMAKLVRTLNEVPARFVRTLAAVRDAKSGT
ncbi:MAG: 50S ribosomal protein L10 [Burkholderiales bacterium]